MPSDDAAIGDLLEGLLHVPADADVRELPPDVERVIVEGLTDARLAALADRAPGLRCLLTAGDARVTDDGLAVLTRFHRLASIDLEWSAITDAGLRHLAAVSTLAWVDVGTDGVTRAGLAWLRRARPDIEVEPGGDE